MASKSSHFTASIDWGDGTTPDSGCTLCSTNCKIVRESTTNVFDVVGMHTYKTKKLFTVQVVLTDSGGSIADAFSTARFFPVNRRVRKIFFSGSKIKYREGARHDRCRSGQYKEDFLPMRIRARMHDAATDCRRPTDVAVPGDRRDSSSRKHTTGIGRRGCA